MPEPQDSRRSEYRDNAERCPHCGVDLQGEPIPADDHDAYGATHFSRKIGISSWELDRVTHWRCPDCGMEWQR